MKKSDCNLMSKLYILIFLVLFASCSTEPDNPEVLLRTDSAFSQMVLDSGMEKAFKHYAANELIKFSITSMQKDSVEENDSINDKKILLLWAPIKANISKDGDLGWTAGTWYKVIRINNLLDTVKQGTYVTFWEKQENGSWKYIIDKGNLSPDNFK